MKKSKTVIRTAYIKIGPHAIPVIDADQLREAYELDDPKHPDYLDNLLAKLPPKDGS